MTKQCASCGEAFEAKRKTAKYCSNRCRQRAFQRASAESEPRPAAPAAPATAGSVAVATATELLRAGRSDAASGRAALALAVRIDTADGETGAGLAALVREHRAALADALREGEQAADPLDELRSRRERKLADG